jgi:ACR3 family arsenite transporter
MGLGVLLGKVVPGLVSGLRDLEFGDGSHINIPIAVLIWLMIYPMMLKIDFASIANSGGSSSDICSCRSSVRSLRASTSPA